MLTSEELYQGFREPQRIDRLREAIARAAETLDRPLKIMEVCGGHTFAIVKYGLDQLLPENLQLVHGPGCPVCVLPAHRIDAAIQLAGLDNSIFVTLGDMLRVPGSRGSLQQARAGGADVHFVYSPLDTLKIARDNPKKQVIYFAIGFETTTPMTALLIEQSRAAASKNLFYHINHVLVPPALQAILDQGSRIDAFIAPGHVSVITGLDIYKPLVETYRTPLVVAGFEPVDILTAVLRILKQLQLNQVRVENAYGRVVHEQGNLKAQKLSEHYFEPRESFLWRGIGHIAASALQLRPEYASCDAEQVFARHCPPESADQPSGCLCGQILRGHAQPADCPLFAVDCTPHSPHGSCMVSNEGACAAYYRYRRS